MEQNEEITQKIEENIELNLGTYERIKADFTCEKNNTDFCATEDQTVNPSGHEDERTACNLSFKTDL